MPKVGWIAMSQSDLFLNWRSCAHGWPDPQSCLYSMKAILCIPWRNCNSQRPPKNITLLDKLQKWFPKIFLSNTCTAWINWDVVLTFGTVEEQKYFDPGHPGTYTLIIFNTLHARGLQTDNQQDLRKLDNNSWSFELSVLQQGEIANGQDGGSRGTRLKTPALYWSQTLFHKTFKHVSPFFFFNQYI